jgi:glycosyltransferase involved in cell wall biosynthesis
MNANVPCCCSKTSSLGEIGAGAALLFDPENPEEIAAAIEQILTDDSTRQKLIAAGKERAKEFDWGKHARQMVELYSK